MSSIGSSSFLTGKPTVVPSGFLGPWKYWVHVTLHLSKPTERIPRLNHNVNDWLWMSQQCWFIEHKKCTTLSHANNRGCHEYMCSYTYIHRQISYKQGKVFMGNLCINFGVKPNSQKTPQILETSRAVQQLRICYVMQVQSLVGN